MTDTDLRVEKVLVTKLRDLSSRLRSSFTLTVVADARTTDEAADALDNEATRSDEARLREALERVKDRCFQADEENWQHDILSIVVPILDRRE